MSCRQASVEAALVRVKAAAGSEVASDHAGERPALGDDVNLVAEKKDFFTILKIPSTLSICYMPR
jgi:hypothetical protein